MSLLFEKVLIIGLGLIGSSVARALKHKDIAKKVIGYDVSLEITDKCKELQICDDFLSSLNTSKDRFDLIILCTPLSSYNNIFNTLNDIIDYPLIITDVGSTKLEPIEEFNRICKNKLISFVPGHPIAGLEKSGPEFGFKELFKNRFCILIPEKDNEKYLEKVKKMWENFEMKVEYMKADHHDRVLAMTSHVPQLIAYSIVSTATKLEETMKNEVIKYSAAGFRDFTRLAGSDPIMWRDIYSLNKEKVIQMLDMFIEDLLLLKKTIKNNDTTKLEEIFSSTKEVRKLIEIAGQAGTFDPTEKK